MTNPAHEALGRLALLTAVAALAVGCQWEVEADSAAQGLAERDGAGECWRETSLEGAPACGVQFPAEIWGECDSCGDIGCSRPNPGWHDCVCHEEGEICFEQDTSPLPDGGIPLPEVCFYRGESCECGDGQGTRYACTCNHGIDECACKVQSDTYFDHELECETTNSP